MLTPFVDIVLATNRVSAFIDDTIGSVLEQTYPHWRLIVVDDGSPDAPAVRRVVRSVRDAIVVRQDARGLPAARNRGISEGASPLIALLDDDDLWMNDKLEKQVDAMVNSPNAVAAFTGGAFIDAEGREFGAGWSAPTLPSRLYVSGAAPLPRIVSLMVRRAAYDAVGPFNETYSLAEDNEFILRLAIHGEMIGVDRPLVRYRRHAGNMSAPNSLPGRQAGRRLLAERLAVHRTDSEIAALLRENRDRFEASSADQCVRSVADALRRRDLRRIGEELVWAGGAPVRTAHALRRALSAPRL